MGACNGTLEKGGFCYNCLQIVRWLPVLFVIAILSWVYYAYVYQLCILTVEDSVQRALYLIGFHILLILFVASYFQTVFASLRYPPLEFYLPKDVLNNLNEAGEDEQAINRILQHFVAHHKLPIRMRAFEGGIRYCPKCKCLKPDRAHHCSMCGQCVLKFDHHCPWVNTCVNFHNYKFFLLFLGYGFVLCMYGFFTDMPFFILFWTDVAHDRSIVMGKFHMLFLFFVSGMFALSLGCLFFYHLFLTARNRTTIESFRAPMLSGGPDKHAFNMGIRSNYRQVFGPNPYLWILPVYTSVGDGLDYEMPVYVAPLSLSQLEAGPVDLSPPLSPSLPKIFAKDSEVPLSQREAEERPLSSNGSVREDEHSSKRVIST